MPTRIENYIIYGLKFGEDFTKDFWEKDFSDEMEWDKNKSKDKPFFISDGIIYQVLLQTSLPFLVQ